MTTLTRLVSIGRNHIVNAVAEEAYLKLGIDLTRPVTVYVTINDRCNVKCLSCTYWRLDHYRDELSIEQWQDILLSLKKLMGAVQINFSGGEPFIKKGFADLMVFAHQNGIHAGVTTNGWALNEKIVDQIVAAHPMNINISVDAPNAELHDELRGHPGLFDRICSGLTSINEAKQRYGVDFPLMIKALIHKRNFRLAPRIVRWAESMGASACNFQPIGKWTDEAATTLWIDEPEIPELESVIRELIDMKRAGARIMNSEATLLSVASHFRDEAAAAPSSEPCRIGMQNLFIMPDGKASICNVFPSVGNLAQVTARDLWYGPEAKKIRKETTECSRLCLVACRTKKPMTEKIKMGLMLLGKSGKRKATAPAAI